MVDATKSLAEELDEIASQINLFGLSRIDPERFHVAKNSIVVRLRRLARAQRGETRRREPSTTWRPPYGDP